MKELIKNKKIKIALVFILLGVILLVSVFIFDSKEDKLDNTLSAIENVFFFLPNDKYDELNDMSDYCKISLVYGTKLLKSDAVVDKNNYDSNLKNGTLKAYSKENVIKSLKEILGNEVSINFDINDDGEYTFLDEDDCKLANKNIKSLSYSEVNGYLFSLEDEEENDSKLFVKWGEPVINDNIVVVHAEALFAIRNGEGKYDIYADKNLIHLAGTASKSNLKSKVKNLYYKSMDYIITLKLENNNYTWTNYEVVDKLYNNDYIVD